MFMKGKNCFRWVVISTIFAIKIILYSDLLTRQKLHKKDWYNDYQLGMDIV